MALTDSDIRYLKYFNRLARFFAHNATHEKLTLEMNNPEKYFSAFGQLFINNYLETGETPDFETEDCDILSVACYLLREEGKLKGAVVDLYSVYRKGGATEEDKEEFRELLKGEK